MKRYLIYLAIISIGSLIFTPGTQASPVSDRTQTVSNSVQTPTTTQITPAVAAVTPQAAPIAPVATPAAPSAPAAVVAVTPAVVQTPAPVVNYPTDHDTIMSEAGIDPSDYGYVDYIVSHESGWRVDAEEPTSGAYGLCQALPGYKMASAGADWDSNPVTQLQWCNNYAVARYGSWYGAYEQWVSNRWW